MTRAEPFRQRKQFRTVDELKGMTAVYSGLTTAQSRDMQRVVTRVFMEKSHDPAAAREVLEMLGLAYRFSDEDDDDENEDDAHDISLLWNRVGAGVVI